MFATRVVPTLLLKSPHNISIPFSHLDGVPRYYIVGPVPSHLVVHQDPILSHTYAINVFDIPIWVFYQTLFSMFSFTTPHNLFLYIPCFLIAFRVWSSSDIPPFLCSLYSYKSGSINILTFATFEFAFKNNYYNLLTIILLPSPLLILLFFDKKFLCFLLSFFVILHWFLFRDCLRCSVICTTRIALSDPALLFDSRCITHPVYSNMKVKYRSNSR